MHIDELVPTDKEIEGREKWFEHLAQHRSQRPYTGDLPPYLYENKYKPGSISVGDLVTAYRSGYHRVVSIEDRSHNPTRYYSPVDDGNGGIKFRLSVYHPSPLCHTVLVADKNGKKTKGTQKFFCDISYCQKITKETIEKIHDQGVKQFVEMKDNLLSLLEEKPSD